MKALFASNCFYSFHTCIFHLLICFTLWLINSTLDCCEDFCLYLPTSALQILLFSALESELLLLTQVSKILCEFYSSLPRWMLSGGETLEILHALPCKLGVVELYNYHGRVLSFILESDPVILKPWGIYIRIFLCMSLLLIVFMVLKLC